MEGIEIRACRPRIQLLLKFCERSSQTSGTARRIAPNLCDPEAAQLVGFGVVLWWWEIAWKTLLKKEAYGHGKGKCWGLVSKSTASSVSRVSPGKWGWRQTGAPVLQCAVLCWAGCTQEDQGWGCLRNQGQHKILIKSSNIPLSFGSDA